jgi:hypothetical protein
MVINAIVPAQRAALFHYPELPATDESHELIPFRVAQPNNIVGLADCDAIGFDGDIWAMIAIGAEAEGYRFHNGLLSTGTEMGLQAG